MRDHMALECVHDWDAVIATFQHHRYEMYGFDGRFRESAPIANMVM